MERSRLGSRALGAILVAVAVLAPAGCGRQSAAETAEAGRDEVSVGPENVAVVVSGKARTGPKLSGSLEPERRAAIRAEVGGPVMAVEAEPGQTVAEGAVLARIEDQAFRDALVSAQSMVRSAEQAVRVAGRDAERAERLVAGGALAERDLEVARSGLVAAQAQLADARSRLSAAQRQADRAVVRAPFAGIVSERPISVGDVVAPGAPLFTIVDPSSMRLSASVPSSELAALRLGLPVVFRVRGYAGRSFTGTITRIVPAADPATRQVPIYVSIPNRSGTLVAGLFAEGQVTSESRSGLLVPAAAVDAAGAAPSVLRLRGGVTERVSVALGLRDEEAELVEITSGVAAGDTLLTGAARGITPGTPVRVSAVADAARK